MSQAKRRAAAAAGFCLLFVLILLVMAMTVYNMAGDKGLLATEMRRLMKNTRTWGRWSQII